MAVPNAQELETKRDEMIAQLEQFKAQVSEGFDQAIDAMRKGEYAGACSVMSTLSAHQAQASVRMRAVLVKNGFMVRERDDA